MIAIENIIKTLIGLLVVWIAASTLVMLVHEWLAGKFRWRQKMLEATIRNMLSDFALSDQVYNHPLIRSLYSGPNGASKPSYIPAGQFAQALMDIILNASSEASLMQYYLYKLRWELFRLNKKDQEEAQKRLNIILALTRRVLVSHADESAQSASMQEIRNGLESLGQDYPDLQPSIESAITTVTVQYIQIRQAIETDEQTNGQDERETANNRYRKGLIGLSITHPRLKQILGALLSELTNASIETESIQVRARQNIEEWFNNSMDRVTGWYRRRSQALAYLLGFAVAFLFNIDSLHIVQALWSDEYLQELYSQKATQLMGMYEEGTSLLEQEESTKLLADDIWFSLPIGWLGLSYGTDNVSTGAWCYWGSNSQALLSGIKLAGKCYPFINTPPERDTLAWISKLAGLLITGLAAAQGAPFWFDILKKFFNIRMAGANPSEMNRAVG